MYFPRLVLILVCSLGMISNVRSQVSWMASGLVSSSFTLDSALNQPEVFRRLDSGHTFSEKGIYWVKGRLTETQGTPQILYLGHVPRGTLYFLQSGSWSREAFGTVKTRANDSLWLAKGVHSPNWGYSRQRWWDPTFGQTFYVKVSHDFQVSIPWEGAMYSSLAWQDKLTHVDKGQDIWQAVFQGAIWAMVLYHLLIFGMKRERVFGTYVLYLISIAFTFWDHFPAGRAWLFEGFPYVGKVFLESMDVGSALMFFVFMRSFIRLKSIYPTGDKVILVLLRITVVGWLLAYLVYAFTLNFYLKASLISLAVPAMLGSIWLVGKLFRSDDPLIGYALAGGGVMIFSTFGNTLIVLFAWLGWGDMPTDIRIYLTEVCVLVQVFIFAMGLGFRIRRTEEQTHKLAELDRLKSRFFANVSHEFRTPLTLIEGPAQQIVEQASQPELQNFGRLIVRNARRLLHLVNQILDLAKLESGNTSLELSPQDMCVFLTQYVATFESAAKSKQVELTLSLGVPSLIMPIDVLKLEQILGNLLSNALKYTSKDGQVEVLLSHDQTSRRVYFKVKDSGTGIATHHLPYIFDRFYQGGHQDYTTDQPSSGIGLALTRELVELHGGQIMVHSTLGEGSIFTFWLPMTESVPNSPEVSPPLSNQPYLDFSLQEPSQTEETTNPATDQQPLILIIEDHQDVRQYLQQCLEKRYRLLFAHDGAAGVEMALKEGPDLIITDVMMPKKDGYTVAKELKASPATSHMPLMMLTGKTSRESKLTGLAASVEAYLPKPFDVQELYLRIEGLLANRQRLKERYSQQLLIDETSVELQDREADWLQKAIRITTTHMVEEHFSIEKLADLLALDRSQLYRKMKALTGQSPSQFVNTCRLRLAKNMIERGEGPISEIAYHVGFSSPAYFNKLFKEKYGQTPGSI